MASHHPYSRAFGLAELTTGLNHSFFGISTARRAFTMQMIPEQGWLDAVDGTQ